MLGLSAALALSVFIVYAEPPAAPEAAKPAASLSPAKAASAEQPSLALLVKRMTGAFNSAEQSKADPENYFDIHLHMQPIWTERTDGPWLYVEQATAKTLEKPYRQRIYKLSEPKPGVFVSAVYTMPEPLSHAGAWKDASKLGGLTPEQLTIREGCAITLSWKDGAFVGATDGQNCGSDLRGAKYATSEATIHADRLVTWDRGYDEKDAQVWGATKGGYVFMRVDEAAAAKDVQPAAVPVSAQ